MTIRDPRPFASALPLSLRVEDRTQQENLGQFGSFGHLR